jgi:hypothetical protein
MEPPDPMRCPRCGGKKQFPGAKLCQLCNESQGVLGCWYPKRLLRRFGGTEQRRQDFAE